MKKGIICCLVVLAVIVIALNAAPKQTEVHSLTDYAYSELESGTIYRADDLLVVDIFAERTESKNGRTTNVINYYLTAFHDKDDRLVVAVLSVDDDDDVFFRLSDYAYDDSQEIGDYYLNGYVKTGSTMASMSGELKKYYNEALDAYGPAMGTYTVTPEYILRYYCNASTDPLKR